MRYWIFWTCDRINWRLQGASELALERRQRALQLPLQGGPGVFLQAGLAACNLPKQTKNWSWPLRPKLAALRMDQASNMRSVQQSLGLHDLGRNLAQRRIVRRLHHGQRFGGPHTGHPLQPSQSSSRQRWCPTNGCAGRRLWACFSERPTARAAVNGWPKNVLRPLAARLGPGRPVKACTSLRGPGPPIRAELSFDRSQHGF